MLPVGRWLFAALHVDPDTGLLQSHKLFPLFFVNSCDCDGTGRCAFARPILLPLHPLERID
jgi:hypothetical protein